MIATIRMSEDLVKTHFRTLASNCAGLEPDPGGVFRRSPAIATKCLLLATRPAEKTAQSAARSPTPRVSLRISLLQTISSLTVEAAVKRRNSCSHGFVAIVLVVCEGVQHLSHPSAMTKQQSFVAAAHSSFARRIYSIRRLI